MGESQQEHRGRQSPDLELVGRQKKAGNTLSFKLPCGTLHREYGPAMIVHISEFIHSENYYLFGVEIPAKLYRELTDITSSGGLNTTFLFAKELVYRKPETANQVREVLERYYGETIARAIVAATVLSL